MKRRDLMKAAAVAAVVAAVPMVAADERLLLRIESESREPEVSDVFVKWDRDQLNVQARNQAGNANIRVLITREIFLGNPKMVIDTLQRYYGGEVLIVGKPGEETLCGITGRLRGVTVTPFWNRPTTDPFWRQFGEREACVFGGSMRLRDGRYIEYTERINTLHGEREVVMTPDEVDRYLNWGPRAPIHA